VGLSSVTEAIVVVAPHQTLPNSSWPRTYVFPVGGRRRHNTVQKKNKKE
jgi:hypothetical protein